MDWYNEPPRWTVDGDTITIRSGPKTDFWRTTHYGFIPHVHATFDKLPLGARREGEMNSASRVPDTRKLRLGHIEVAA